MNQLTSEQRQLITGFLYQWNPIKVVVRKMAGINCELRRLGLDDDEILSHCYDGIVSAASKYKADRGCAFATWAILNIRQRLQAVIQTSRALKRGGRSTFVDFNGNYASKMSMLDQVISEDTRLYIAGRIESALSVLTDGQKLAIQATYFVERPTIKEAAKSIGCSPHNLLCRRNRAYRKLAPLLQDVFDEYCA